MGLNINLKTTDNTAHITLNGELDGSTAPLFKEAVERAIKAPIERLILNLQNLDYMASAGLRVLIFAKQKMGANTDIYIVGAQEMVMDTLMKTGFIGSVIVVDEYNPTVINA